MSNPQRPNAPVEYDAYGDGVGYHDAALHAEPGYEHHDHFAEYDEYDGHDGYGGYEDHDQYEAAAPASPRRSRRGVRRSVRRRRRAGLVVLAIAALVILVAVLAVVWVDRQANPSGRPGAVVTVAIPKDSSSAQIGSVLAKAGVIHSGGLFRYYVKLHGAGPLLAGAYRLHRNSSYDSVISSLQAGPVIAVQKLTIPEGYTLHQIAAKLAALPGAHLSAPKFIDAANSGQVRSPYEPAGVNDLEGLVFPATYEVKQTDDEVQVLQEMVDRFTAEANSLGLNQAAATLGMTPYQVVTVASIVEREAKLDGDRGPVASTIYNRLKAGQTLGADSTLVYALRQRDPNVNPAKVDYNQANPYNTRTNKGLPPSPISNPGAPSLKAAISPPATNYLYFVEVNPDGQLGFASTNEGFKQLTAACQAAHLC